MFSKLLVILFFIKLYARKNQDRDRDSLKQRQRLSNSYMDADDRNISVSLKTHEISTDITGRYFSETR